MGFKAGRSGLVAAAGILAATAALADPYAFSTGTPDGLIATASRPASSGKAEIESADDFVLGQATALTSATFTGLLVGGDASSIGAVGVEFYRVFPLDSQSPPSGDVPTRVNSPSDLAAAALDSAGSGLSYSVQVLSASFTAANSVLTGINPFPNQTTGGDGAVTGLEVRFTVTFAAPLLLAADHYFFVPQVALSGAGSNFYWLSAPKPIVAPSTPFAPDLQSWIRNAALDPDWLRVGTDITQQGPFNAAFTLSGETVAAVPEPASWLFTASGLVLVGGVGIRRRGPRR